MQFEKEIVKLLFLENKKIGVIKEVRDLTGLCLKDSKAVVDKYLQHCDEFKLICNEMKKTREKSSWINEMVNLCNARFVPDYCMELKCLTIKDIKDALAGNFNPSHHLGNNANFLEDKVDFILSLAFDDDDDVVSVSKDFSNGDIRQCLRISELLLMQF